MRNLVLAYQGIMNMIFHKPLCVSFEITHNCNARCRHCHRGEPVVEQRASPEKYAELCEELSPVVAQVSGGEPLLREDLDEIIRVLRRSRRPPYIVITTNASHLTKERFRRLLHCGVDAYSISFDYPDERHDDFRQIPGLFQRIKNLINALDSGERNHITLSCVVHKENYREIIPLTELALQWNVKMNFSTYTWLRTNDKGLMLTKSDIIELKAIVASLLRQRKRYKNLFATAYTFDKMIRFFDKGNIPNCQAGVRFLIVNPDGSLSPCGLIVTDYKNQQELIDNFTRVTDCTDCITSSRANSEKSVLRMFSDGLRTIFS